MCKSCHQDKSAQSHRMLQAIAIVLLILGLAISIHLFISHVAFWWLPFVIVLVLAHATIVGGLVWLVSRARHNHFGPASEAGEASGEHSHVLHNPRAYDWLARVVTLGGETRFRRRILDLAQLKAGEKVLDVGCGTGTLVIGAAKRVGPSGSAHGVDRSMEMLAHARHKAITQGVSAEFRESSSNHLPFQDASFDVAFSTLMFHHLPAPMQMATVAQMCRVVRPGGRIIIVDMQRPKDITAIFSHVGLIHLFRSRATMPDWQRIEGLLEQHGVQLATRQAVWGETVCALVGRTAVQI